MTKRMFRRDYGSWLAQLEITIYGNTNICYSTMNPTL